VESSCERGNEPSGSIKCWETTEWLHRVSYGSGVEPGPPILPSSTGLMYQPWMIDGDHCGAISGMNEWQGNPKYWDEPCSSAALHTTDLT
jgi:hypothetical protein